MATVTLSDMRNRSKELADMVGSNFISDPRWNAWINEGAAILYDLQVAAYGEDYYVADPVSFNTVSGQDAYSISSDIGVTDFYKLVGVDIVFNSNDIRPLRKFRFKDRAKSTLSWSSHAYRGIRYRLRGSKLWLSPTPSTAQAMQLWYIPSMTKMSDDADTFDAQNNWETYIINYTARKALIKEESDVSEIERDMLRVEKHIEGMVENRDMGEENQATDVYWYDYEDTDLY